VKEHNYSIGLEWTGNTGSGTTRYNAYERRHRISVQGKPDLLASSDPTFLGDRTRYNPEELLVAALSSCHMLWFLHLCSEAGVIVSSYKDDARGTMIETADGNGYFSEVTLRPVVTVITAEMVNAVPEIHTRAHELCFIANSVNFKVHCQGTCIAES